MADEPLDQALQRQDGQKPGADKQRQQAQTENQKGFPTDDMGKNRGTIKSQHGFSFGWEKST